MAASVPRSEQFPETTLTAAQLRTIAHPMRYRLLEQLRRRSPATASDLARALGTNTGVTSYHLRQLADVGLIVEDTERRAGRQRWWRAAHLSHGWVESEIVDGPDTQAAADWIKGHDLRVFTRAAEQALAARAGWPRPWRDRVSEMDMELALTPSEVAALNRELADLLFRYQQLPTDRETPEGEDRQIVWYVVHALPQLDADR